jgi:hypothetical protein
MSIKHIGNFWSSDTDSIKRPWGGPLKRKVYFYDAITRVNATFMVKRELKNGETKIVEKKLPAKHLALIMYKREKFDVNKFQKVWSWRLASQDYDLASPTLCGLSSRSLYSFEKLGKLDGFFYTFDEKIYRATVDYDSEEAELLIKEKEYKRKARFNKLKKAIELYEKLEASEEISREPIPETVKIFVWRRDDGKCVKCGSKSDLEFDHIIPVSKGGSSTERNIQLLCVKCNREKSDKI